MNRNYRKKMRQALFIRRFLLIVSLLLMMYFFHLLYNQNKVKADLEKDIITYSKEIDELNATIKILEKDHKRKDSLEYIEKIAREKLGMVKANELIVIDENIDEPHEEEENR
ncbi:MAG: septum formation initiator family protein [Tissierellia bacterium]|nr:septum formation initiator family protein [Tissierellia bacterium]